MTVKKPRKVQRIDIFKYSDYRLFINDVFQQRCHRNRRYSLRAYARDLKVSCGQLSEFLRGKRHIAEKRLPSIGPSLNLTDAESRYFVAIAKKARDGKASSHNDERALVRREGAYASMNSAAWPGAELSLREFSLVIVASLWEGLATKDIQRLFPKTSLDDIERACGKLQELGWLKENDEGTWTAPYGFLRSDGNDPSSGVRAFHRQLLEAGLVQLEDAPVSERFFYASLFSLSTKEYQSLCKAIEGFALDRSDSIDTRDQHDRIYALGFQLLPITASFPSRRKKMLGGRS